MPDITAGQASQGRQNAPPPAADAGRIEAVITRGWNAYMVQVTLIQNGESRQLVGKEVTSAAVAETVARVFAASHGVPWEKVEVISG